MADTAARVFRFGPFEADLGNRQLLRNGVSVSLRGQPFEVLALLLERAGQLVTREQLRVRLWAPGTVVGFDHSIHAAVTKLREVLGDDAEHPLFIATVPRHGYRFIGAVSTPATPAPEPETALYAPGHRTPGTAAAAPQPDVVDPPRELTIDHHSNIDPRTIISNPLAPARALPSLGRWLRRVTTAVLIVALAYVVANRFWISRHYAAAQSAVSSAHQTALRIASSNPGDAFNPPAHSIAVLPFVNISEDKKEEYFADGLTEEILSALTHISDLQVVAQTSSFYFKGKDADLGTIARRLNVGTVLEGSVRRTGHSVRITAQLINATTGYHFWSHTYDRNLGDMLAVQTDIANAVASALKITLLGDVGAKIGVGGTQNPAAFDAYIRALRTASAQHGDKDLRNAIAGYTEAIRQDPHYALAFAGRSFALRFFTSVFARGPAIREGWDQVEADARKAVALAPDLADGHVALASFLENRLKFAWASDEYERALTLAPSNVRALRYYGLFAVCMGRRDAGLTAARRAVALDPLDRVSHYNLGWALFYAHQYQEALGAFQHSAALDPDFDPFSARGFAYYVLGDYQSARVTCEGTPTRGSQMCLAIAYDKLGQRADAEAMLAKLQGARGEAASYEYAEVYAQWGDIAHALNQLESAMRLRDDRMGQLMVDPLLDPLRKEARFEAIERELRFPQ